jgi:hypothetical protein
MQLNDDSSISRPCCRTAVKDGNHARDQQRVDQPTHDRGFEGIRIGGVKG